MDLVQEAITKDEDLAGVWLAELGNDATTLAQSRKRFRGGEGLLEDASCTRKRVLGDELYGFVERRLGARRPNYSAASCHLRRSS